MLPEPREHGPEIQQGTIETILESVDSEARQGLKEALDICLNILDICKVDFRSFESGATGGFGHGVRMHHGSFGCSR